MLEKLIIKNAMNKKNDTLFLKYILMKNCFLFLSLLFFLSCTSSRKASPVTNLIASKDTLHQTPASDFSHIMLIIDSTAFAAMAKDSFITKQLAFAMQDTMKSSLPVYSLYLWGQENFLHFNPNKGWFTSQLGTAYIIFQSKKPGVGKALEDAWKAKTNDPLISYDFEGPDFTLTEIIFKEHEGLSKSSGNHLIPMLSSYSATSYKNWNLPDTTESSMKDFINSVDSQQIKNKLFHKIQSTHLVISSKELQLLRSMLLTVGYVEKTSGFYKKEQPDINYTIDERTGRTKVKSISLLLTQPAEKKSISLSDHVRLEVNKTEAKYFFD